MPPKNGTLKLIKWTVTIILITAGAIGSGYAIVDSLKDDIHKNTTEITRNKDSNKTVHDKITSLETQMEKGFGELEQKFENMREKTHDVDTAIINMLQEIRFDIKDIKKNGDSG